MRWSPIAKMWRGRTVAILASGPSMSQAIADKVHTAGLPAIAINTTYLLAPWADVLYAADARWWENYRKDVASFKGLKLCCDSGDSTVAEDVKYVRDTGTIGFDESPHCVRTGGNSGYQAIHVAVHAGARRILLLGFDMRHYGARGHWHSRHPDPLRNAGEGIYERWLERFGTLAAPLKERGVEVLNCTPGSALTVWPITTLEAALEKERECAA